MIKLKIQEEYDSIQIYFYILSYLHICEIKLFIKMNKA